MGRILCIAGIRISLIFVLTCHITIMYSQSMVRLETTKGNVIIRLYDDTPLHRDNFIKLVSEKYYDSILFHRVIQGFMIQTGDPESKHASPGDPLGFGGPSYKIRAEINPGIFHKKGALAAARQGDAVNPQKESSGSQFYIVHGKPISLLQLESMERTGQHTPFTESQKLAYTTVGGTPHLDNSYTVFGEVIEGIEVIDSIAGAATDNRNRPVEDIRIISATIIP